MRPLTRTASVLTIGVLTAGAMSLGGVSTAAPSSTCGYPPTQCGITFDLGSYFPRDVVHFRSDRAFTPGETVDGGLRCANNFHRARGPFTAGPRHRVRSHFTLPRRTPRGTCTFRLVGETSGRSASGTFNVKHHH
jgi:hypothetical protein